jgi:ankyrin repeat protein
MAQSPKSSLRSLIVVSILIPTFFLGAALLALSRHPDYWLQVASRAGTPGGVPLLISLGANPSPIEIDDQPLWQAALRGNVSTVRALLDVGANVHASDDFALGIAAKYGRTDVVRLLIARGADFHAHNDWALRIASSKGQLEAVRELLKAGADAHVSDDEAIRWALESGHSDVVDLLQTHGKDTSPHPQTEPKPDNG